MFKLFTKIWAKLKAIKEAEDRALADFYRFQKEHREEQEKNRSPFWTEENIIKPMKSPSKDFDFKPADERGNPVKLEPPELAQVS